MAKELYIYSPFYDFIVENLISQIEDNMNVDITLRENSPGGSVYSAYGAYTKIKEHGKVHLKVDGAAMSAGAFLPLYCKSSECLDVSRFVFHRADMYVSNDEDQAYLDGINADLKAKMKMKIDSKIFKQVTGYSIEDMFNPEKRIDITLTGAEAKKIGLIDKVVKLTPEMQSEITAFNNKYYSVAAEVNEPPAPVAKTNSNTKIIMTIEKLKSEHPAIYAEVVALGVAQEKDRVEACLVFADIDPKAVKAAIESGKPLSQKQISELTLKSLSPEILAKLSKETPAAVVPGAAPLAEETQKEKDLKKYEAEIDKSLGLKK